MPCSDAISYIVLVNVSIFHFKVAVRVSATPRYKYNGTSDPLKWNGGGEQSGKERLLKVINGKGMNRWQEGWDVG